MTEIRQHIVVTYVLMYVTRLLANSTGTSYLFKIIGYIWLRMNKIVLYN